MKFGRASEFRGSVNEMKIYFENPVLKIRSMVESDAETFFKIFQSYGWNHEKETYQGYYRDQEKGARNVYVAEYEGKVAGYCTVVFRPQNGPWKGEAKPEICDLRVFNEYQHKGIGNRILSVLEEDVAAFADEVTLAVGLHYGYGRAQRLYVKRGYLPDGSGVWYGSQVVEQYADCCNDDSLNLYMSKKLK